MASKRVTLKWRKINGEWRAGPFMIDTSGTGAYMYVLKIQSPVISVAFTRIDAWMTLADAKRACENLAARILGAMK